MRLVPFPALLIVAGLLLLHTMAHGGPDHDAAMALVEQGKGLTPTGDLDRAMSVFRSVEHTYPEEYTAIGYARWWIANCLLAGGRNGEVREAMEPVVEWVKDGRIAGPRERLLFLHQYARILPRGDELAKVAGDAVLDQLAAGVEGLEQDLWLRSAWTFADDAGARDATGEAIAPLALGLVCYPEAEIADWARRE